MKIKIKHRFNGSVLFSIEAGSLRLGVEAAVEADANLQYADLRHADLRHADFRDADLGYVNLQSANLVYANLVYANLRDANLVYANLGSANLRDADLRSADLRYADLGYANLQSADLRYADLRHADFRSADLRSADLGYAMGVSASGCTPLLMLLDQPGKIRAYKLVDKNNVGPFSGGIKYEVGKTYTVDDADTDVNTHCGAGINLATLDWCMANWSKGYKILIAEFTAKDIAAIPTATDGKFRCHKIKIIGEKNLAEIGLVKSAG